MVFFVTLALKTVMITKKVIISLSEHTKGIPVTFMHFSLRERERVLFFFEIISSYITYACEYSKSIVQHTIYFDKSARKQFSG